MMVCIHAAIGAAVGAVARRPGAAFFGGVFSHLVCDLIPHKDYDIKIEAPLAAVVFTYLAKRYGVRSPQFIGAVGAVIPDAENALFLLGHLPKEKLVFPTHNENAAWFLGHGRKLDSPLSQVILGIVALIVAEKMGDGKDEAAA